MKQENKTEKKQSKLGSMIRIGLVAGGLAALLNGGCELPPRGQAFMRGLGEAAAYTAVQEGVKKQMGHEDYNQENLEVIQQSDSGPKEARLNAIAIANMGYEVRQHSVVVKDESRKETSSGGTLYEVKIDEPYFYIVSGERTEKGYKLMRILPNPGGEARLDYVILPYINNNN